MSTCDPPLTADPALAMARQVLYRFAALSLLDPRQGAWAELKSLDGNPVLLEAAGLVRSLPEAVAEPRAVGERPLTDLEPAAILRKLPESAERFNEHYERIFGLVVCKACPPYETEYISSKFAFQRSNTLADINGFYRAFGVAVSQRNKERPDHVVQQLEFMAFLIGLTRQTESLDAPQRAERFEICHQAQHRFLREHLSWWAPTFAMLLAREDPGGFYEEVASFLAALLGAERALFRIPPPHVRPAPSKLEEPEACDGCMLGG